MNLTELKNILNRIVYGKRETVAEKQKGGYVIPVADTGETVILPASSDPALVRQVSEYGHMRNVREAMAGAATPNIWYFIGGCIMTAIIFIVALVVK